MRITFLLALAAIIALAAYVAPLHAQEPAGSISGRIYTQDCPGCDTMYGVLVIPADMPQPLTRSFVFDNSIHTDVHGNYTFSGLADGEYFVVFITTGVDLAVEPPATVSMLLDPPGPLSPPPGGDPLSPPLGGEQNLRLFPAIPVTIAGGESVTGVDFVIKAPEWVSDGPPGEDAAATPTDTAIAAATEQAPLLPDTGAGAGTSGGGRAGGYVRAGLLGLVLLALAGGVALQRARR